MNVQPYQKQVINSAVATIEIDNKLPEYLPVESIIKDISFLSCWKFKGIDTCFKMAKELQNIHSKIGEKQRAKKIDSELTALKEKEYKLLLQIRQEYNKWYKEFNYEDYKKERADIDHVINDNILCKPVVMLIYTVCDIENKGKLKNIYKTLQTLEKWYK